MRERINVLIHGEPKTGKTTMAARRNPGLLICDTEGSSKFMRGVKREKITSMSHMDTILGRIRNGEVTMLAIDTIDELVNNFGKEEVRAKGGDFVYQNQLTMQGWGLLRDRVLRQQRGFRDAGADTLTICHSELLEKPNGGKKWTMKLPSDYAREVMGMADVVGFMEVKKSPDGTRTHRLHLEPSPAYDAGVRAIYDATTDKFYSPLPPFIDDPAFIDIVKAYDDFFDGKSQGYVIPCQNPKCAGTNGVPNDSQIMTAGMLLCGDCDARYKELHKSA